MRCEVPRYVIYLLNLIQCLILPSRLQDAIIPRLIEILSRASSDDICSASHLVFKQSIDTFPLHTLLVDHVALCTTSIESGNIPYEDVLTALPSRMVCLVAAKLRHIYGRRKGLANGLSPNRFVEYLVDGGY